MPNRSLTLPTSISRSTEKNLENHPALSQKPIGDDFSLDLPPAEELFQVHAEETLRRKIQDEARKRGVKTTEFPQDAKPVEKDIDFSQIYTPRAILLPPGNICFKTLYFQDVSRERYLHSWTVGEPVREAFLFYGEVLTLPARMAVVPPWRIQCWQYPFVH